MEGVKAMKVGQRIDLYESIYDVKGYADVMPKGRQSVSYNYNQAILTLVVSNDELVLAYPEEVKKIGTFIIKKLK